jgi:hypothetical protein
MLSETVTLVPSIYVRLNDWESTYRLQGVLEGSGAGMAVVGVDILAVNFSTTQSSAN